MEQYDKNVTAILEFLVAKNFSASVMRVYYLYLCKNAGERLKWALPFLIY